MDERSALRPILRATHDYWCGHLAHEADFPHEKAPIWFTRSDETDAFIRDRFGPHLDAVAAANWDVEALSGTEQIGLVVMLDQFPRNIFRDDGRAFAYDRAALRHAKALIAGGVARFALIERVFLYLPLEHSEALADQDESVRLYEVLAAAAPEDQTERYAEFLDYAEKHRTLIRRFGRFPHRNVDLGRTTTPEEAAFLAENGRGY